MESAVSRLGLGVGRLGLAGGGVRAQAEAFAAAALAADAGVRLLDCPPLPEAAERMLGEVLPREPAFRMMLRAADGPGGPGAVAGRLKDSLRRLGLERADAVLARPSAVAGEGGQALWAALQRLKHEGAVERIGILACVCDDPRGLARRLRPDLMQLPLSLLDQRLLADGSLGEIAGMGVEVHLHSVSLQGLLFGPAAPAAGAPAPLSPASLSPQVSRLRRLLAEAGADPMQAALGFALSRPEAARVVVGIGSAAELQAVVRAANAPSPVLDWKALRFDAPCPAGPCLAAA